MELRVSESGFDDVGSTLEPDIVVVEVPEQR